MNKYIFYYETPSEKNNVVIYAKNKHEALHKALGMAFNIPNWNQLVVYRTYKSGRLSTIVYKSAFFI